MFKPKKLLEREKETIPSDTNFMDVLRTVILKEKNSYLQQAYDVIVTRQKPGEDYIFL